MGRMILSLFYHCRIDLFHPTKLSKRTKIFFSENKKDFLIFYGEIAKNEDLKYLQLYLNILSEMFVGGEYLEEDVLGKGMVDYGKLLQKAIKK